MCLRGNAKQVLGELSVGELEDFDAIKTALERRFDPAERESLKRVEFSGLPSKDLRRHVQFNHPSSIHEAVALASEFESFDEKFESRKPENEEAVRSIGKDTVPTLTRGGGTSVGIKLADTDRRNVFVPASKKEKGLEVPRCQVDVEREDLFVPVTNVKEVEAGASGSAWSADVEVGRKEDGLSRKPRMCCKREESMQCCEKRSRVLTRARGQGLTDQVTASDMQRNSDLGLCPREVTPVVPDGDGRRDAASRKGGSEVTQSERAAPASDGTSADRPKGSMEDNMSGTSLEGREMEEQCEQKEAEANEVVSEGSSVCVPGVSECNLCVLEEHSGKKETETNEVVSDSSSVCVPSEPVCSSCVIEEHCRQDDSNTRNVCHPPPHLITPLHRREKCVKPVRRAGQSGVGERRTNHEWNAKPPPTSQCPARLPRTPPRDRLRSC
ncbi:hypothetical protein C0Q70_08616 [Pomacea canaliculata]|uniref:Uncharacterized protein n=1 Tax=Pomacea canaliculata TaxID=400727 RepID=A0A2T7P7F9_POMCA|nr:hypothetical protein C0Q70_08616 [Pomacea canaliculata]